VSDLDLEPDSVLSLRTLALDPMDAGAGAPPTRLRELGTFGSVEVGVWEMEPGVATDTEVDELFVVLTGAGTIDLLDAGRSLEIAAGDLVRLAAGTRTRWIVTATLRKLYLAP
jgi:uncharacterized cupin superfamily protein